MTDDLADPDRPRDEDDVPDALAPLQEHPAEPVGPANPVDANPVDPAVEPFERAIVQDRRYPSTVGGACYLAILLTAGTGIGIVMAHEWRVGVRVISGALVAAGALRLLLPERDAGMLAVRHRFVDVSLLVGIALALYFLAGDIPDQPA